MQQNGRVRFQASHSQGGVCQEGSVDCFYILFFSCFSWIRLMNENVVACLILNSAVSDSL
jgi:hypothetical protein